MTIGTELRQAREQRGLTLAAISERTKIRVPVLRAIERDDFTQLPGGVISRGFLRLFAREVGLDANEIGARFTAEFEAAGPGLTGEATPAHDGASANGAGAGTSSAGLRAAGFALAGLVLLALGYFALRPVTTPPGRDADQPATAAGPVATTAAAAAPGAPSGATSAPNAGAPSEPAPAAKDTSPLRVDLLASDACWVSATADGEQVAFRALKPGERLAVRATREVVLRIGVPGNLGVSINEQPMPPPVRPGTPITLRITPANYRDLLKR